VISREQAAESRRKLIFGTGTTGEARNAAAEVFEARATKANSNTRRLLPPNPPNRRIRTRTYGGVGGEESRDSPLSRSRPGMTALAV